jgi:hypothetical protein
MCVFMVNMDRPLLNHVDDFETSSESYLPSVWILCDKCTLDRCLTWLIRKGLTIIWINLVHLHLVLFFDLHYQMGDRDSLHWPLHCIMMYIIAPIVGMGQFIVSRQLIRC